MNIANTPDELDDFLENVINISSFKLEETNFLSQTDWNFKDGALSHRTGGFFDVIGIEDSSKKEHLLLYQPQSALTGLAICVHQGEIYVLLQARIEPGNSGIGQYGPTIQSTPANYLALHGGNKTSLLKLFYGYSSQAKPLSSSMQLDLGERYFQKSKWHNFVLVKHLFETENYMKWVSLNTIKKRLFNDNYLNADLRSLLAVFNWDKLLPKYTINKSYRFDNVILNTLLTNRNLSTIDYRIKPLERLKDWRITDDSIISDKQGNILVKLYHTHTSNNIREVAAWNQPLMLAQSRGLVSLSIRKVNQNIECLLSINKEIGIENNYLVTTSSIVNPGEPNIELSLSHDEIVLHEFIQSDEGGRFYKHESLYRIILIGRDIKINKNQLWIPLLGLKQILGMSNIASFQLRCISSALLFHMNKTL